MKKILSCSVQLFLVTLSIFSYSPEAKGATPVYCLYAGTPLMNSTGIFSSKDQCHAQVGGGTVVTEAKYKQVVAANAAQTSLCQNQEFNDCMNKYALSDFTSAVGRWPTAAEVATLKNAYVGICLNVPDYIIPLAYPEIDYLPESERADNVCGIFSGTPYMQGLANNAAALPTLIHTLTSGPGYHAPVPPQGMSYLMRFYNANSNRHVYTTNMAEANALAPAGWNPEGVTAALYTTPNAVPGLLPLYRIYFPGSDQHFYTSSKAVNDAVILQYQGKSEGIVGYIGTQSTGNNKPLYHAYSNLGGHFYTSSASELQTVLNSGWTGGDVVGYVW